MNGLIKNNSTINLLKHSIKTTTTSSSGQNVKRILQNNNNNNSSITTTTTSSTSTILCSDNNNNDNIKIRNYISFKNNNNNNNNSNNTNYNNIIVDHIENDNKKNNLTTKKDTWESGSQYNFFKPSASSSQLSTPTSQSEVYQICNKKLLDKTTGEINFLKFKELIDNTRSEEFAKHVFGWCSKVMKTREVNILESFLFYFRRSKSMEFLRVLDYINQNDIPQNIFIFNITLFYYSEMNMVEEAKRLADLLLNMNSPLPEKAYLAIVKTFERDLSLLKLVEDRMKQDKELGVCAQLYNELIIAYIQNHRNLDLALPLLERLEESGTPVFQSSVVTLLNFFYNNGMPDRSIELLKNVSDKYPEWYKGQGFCEKITPMCYLLLDRITDLITHMEKNNTLSKVFFNNLIEICSNKANKNGVIKIYNLMIKKFAPDAHTLKDLIYLAVRDNNLQECLYWYKTLEDLKYTLNSKIASYLIKFFIRSKHYQFIGSIIDRVKKDPSLYTPMTVGSIIYYTGMVSTNLSDESIYNEFYAYTKKQNIQFKEDTTDFIIQHCLMEDKYEDAERWFSLKEQFQIAPSRDTFANFLAYHTVRSEFQQYSQWKNKMSQYVHSNDPSAISNQMIFDYFDKFYPNKQKSPQERREFLNKQKLQNDQLIGSTNLIAKVNQDNIDSFRSLVKDRKLPEAFNLFYQLLKKEEEFERNSNNNNNNNNNSSNSSSKKILPISKEFYQIALEASIRYFKSQDVEKLFKIYLDKGFIPTLELVIRALEVIYRSNKTEYYQQFIANPPHGAEPEFYKIANAVIHAKYSIRKCIQLLSLEENIYLTNNDHVKNALLHGLVTNNDMDRASRLIRSLLEKVPLSWIDINTLLLYLEKIVEQEYYSDLVPIIYDYLQANKVFYPQNVIRFALASNSFVTGNVQDAYNKVQDIILESSSSSSNEVDNISNSSSSNNGGIENNNNNNSVDNNNVKTTTTTKKNNNISSNSNNIGTTDNDVPWLSLQQLNLIIRIYSKQFPIPPDHNYSHWLTLLKLAERNKIHKNSAYSQIFKCLTDMDKLEFIRKTVKGPNFSFASIPQDVAFYILNAYKDNPRKLLVFASTILKTQQISEFKSHHLIKETYDKYSKSGKLEFQPLIPDYIEKMKIIKLSHFERNRSGVVQFNQSEIDFLDRNVIKFSLSPRIKYDFENLINHQKPGFIKNKYK